MWRPNVHGYRTNRRVRRDHNGCWGESNDAHPYCTKCSRHGCKFPIESKTWITKGNKSLKYSGYMKGVKWARNDSIYD